MPMPSVVEKLLLSFLFLLTASSSTNVGVTYNSSCPNLPHPDHVVAALQSLGVPAVRLLGPSPSAIRAFSGSGITLLISTPNDLVFSFAANSSAASLWVYNNVVPFYPASQITVISVGDSVLSIPWFDDDDGYPDPASLLIPAMHNVRIALATFGIKEIVVSTTFSFDRMSYKWFPPSSAKISTDFYEPFFHFFEEVNSSLLLDINPYHIFRQNTGIPVAYAMFQDYPLNYREDMVTGVRYHNVFDGMIQSIVTALEKRGHGHIPVIVTETGWPTAGEADATEANAELYLRGLSKHLMNEAISEVYIYQLFDGCEKTEDSDHDNGDGSSNPLLQWGIMNPNMSMRFNSSEVWW